MHVASHRPKGPGVASLCPWVEADDGVVTDGKGRLIAGFWANPPDAASSSEEEREETARITNEALKNFGTGCAWWADVAVTPAASYPAPHLSHFPDPVSRMLDEERRRMFQAEGAHFENERPFVVCYTPPAAKSQRLGHMMYRRDGRGEATPQELARRAFRGMLDRFETRAGGELRLRRMREYRVTDLVERVHRRDELVNYLHYCLTGRAIELDLPDAAMPLSGVVGGLDLEPGHFPAMGDHYIACVAVNGFPAEAVPGVLDRLSMLELPGGYRFSQRAIPEDEVEAVASIETQRKFWRQRMSPFFATIFGLGGGATNEDAARMYKQCETSLALSKSGNVKHVWYSAVVVLRHRDPAILDAMAKEVERAIGRCGFAAQVETENATDAFLGTLPGNVANNVKRPMVHTFNVADLAPSSGIWTGSPTNPNPLYPPGAPALMHARTEGGVPFRHNNCSGDNGNFSFFGPPGSGKTTLLNGTCLQFLRYRGARVRSIDFKRGMKASCLAVGGAYHELGGEASPAFCPYEHLATGPDRDWAKEWTEVVFELQHGRPPSPEQRTEVIHRMVERLASEPARSITHALMFCHDDEVAEALAYYSLDGTAGRLFDGEGGDEAGGETHWDAYDITDVLNSGDKVLLPALMCLERRFDRIEDGRPILETIDEAWAAVSHPIWRPRLRRRWKTKRSKCVSIGIATQNLADIVNKSAGTADGGMLSILLENVPLRIYGANPEAHLGGTEDERGPADFYKAFGLTQRQRTIVQTLVKAREYYVTAPEGRRVVDFGFGPAMLALAGATSEAEVLEVSEMHAAHGPDWVWRWFDKKGVDHASLLGR